MSDQVPFVVERRFRSPRGAVFKAWTEVASLKGWFAPVGMTMTQAAMDLRPGGAFHYALKAAMGPEMWGKWEFLEIVAPDRITLLQSFSNAAGGVTRHPLSATWPLLTHSTMTFTDLEGETLVAIAWTPHQATDIECATFDAARPLMLQAWGGTLEQLGRYLQDAS